MIEENERASDFVAGKKKVAAAPLLRGASVKSQISRSRQGSVAMIHCFHKAVGEIGSQVESGCDQAQEEKRQRLFELESLAY